MKLQAIVMFLMVITIVASSCAGVSLEPTIPPDVVEQLKGSLGYALAPHYLPEGFQFARYDKSMMINIGTPVFYLAYSSPIEGHHIVISYPEAFYPEGNPMFKFLGISLQRPSDAISEVWVNGKTAYLIRGFWSKDTIEKMIPTDNYSAAKWDYDFYLSLHFKYDINASEAIGVTIMASNYAPQWMTTEEMVRIAESIGRVN